MGYLEKLVTAEENLKNFKEVIRKEVWEQIVKGMTLIFSEPESLQYVSDSDTDKSSIESLKRNNILKVKDAVINLVKKTKDKVAGLQRVNIQSRSYKKKVDLVDNAKIKRESRTKRSFYLGDDNNSWSIEEFAPKIFQNIRRIYKVKNEEVLSIFKEDYASELDINISTGKTGSFFLK